MCEQLKPQETSRKEERSVIENDQEKFKDPMAQTQLSSKYKQLTAKEVQHHLDTTQLDFVSKLDAKNYQPILTKIRGTSPVGIQSNNSVNELAEELEELLREGHQEASKNFSEQPSLEAMNTEQPVRRNDWVSIHPHLSAKVGETSSKMNKLLYNSLIQQSNGPTRTTNLYSRDLKERSMTQIGQASPVYKLDSQANGEGSKSPDQKRAPFLKARIMNRVHIDQSPMSVKQPPRPVSRVE